MNVEKRNVTIMKFGELPEGSCFEYQGFVYIKTTELDKCNAIDLTNGSTHVIEKSSNIWPAKGAKVVIE